MSVFHATNGTGQGCSPDLVDRRDHAEVARWLLTNSGCLDYDHASQSTLATLANAHAALAVADAIREAMREANLSSSRDD